MNDSSERGSRFPLLLASLAALAGAGAALAWARAGLTLSHYDAKAHLVVARRIFDSLTPGWQQIGAVWLPLPHLLNMIPVQIDAAYRTGASGVAISVVAFAGAVFALATIVLQTTGSRAGALAAAAVFATNPNVLYLTSTPMTEPLLMALTLAALAALQRWVLNGARDAGHAAGALLTAACLTRYEAWPVAGAALAVSLLALWRGGLDMSASAARVWRVARWPAGAVVLFLIESRITVGEWFVSSGFFVAENKSLGQPLLALAEIGYGVARLSVPGVLWVAVAAACVVAAWSVSARARGHALIPLCAVASAVLPWYAFLHGHPFRIRYGVPLIAAEAVAVGLGVGLLGRLQWPAAGALALLLALAARPLDVQAPMVVEAQWDQPNIAARRAVTRCLVDERDGEKIMASMGSLAHYMQETASAGFRLRDFLHEGNGDIWLTALDGPHRFVGWILIEEKAEGGDMLARHARDDPHFLEGFRRVCSAAGLALYRREPAADYR